MTGIQVSEGLLQQLLQWSEAKNPDEALREAIDAFIRLRKRKYLQDLKGKLDLDIDLEQLRGKE